MILEPVKMSEGDDLRSNLDDDEDYYKDEDEPVGNGQRIYSMYTWEQSTSHLPRFVVKRSVGLIG